jgi:hypothetical protein
MIDSLERAVFAGHALAPDLRARIELMRERASSRDGLTLTCGGVSMEPVLRLGDRVRVGDAAPARGCVAAFVNRRGSLELHRLILSTFGVGWWVHAGDNQVSRELGLVHASQLVGVAALPVVAPSAVMLARASVRLAQAAGRLTWAALRGDDDAAWRHVPATGAPAELDQPRAPR